LDGGDRAAKVFSVKKIPPPSAIPRARKMRREMTDAERAMWRLLKECAPDERWRRHVPLRHFIVDFASHRAKLVVEVDGGQHSEDRDAARTAIIEAEGYRVLRFWNNEVLGNPEGCARVLMDALAARSPPSNSG
jgi:very-short-patch-repair endonuclease